MLQSTYSVWCPRWRSLPLDEMLRIERFGVLKSEQGPRLAYIPSFSRVQVLRGVLLDATQYVYVTNCLTGAKRIVRGPSLVFPLAFEDVGSKTNAITIRQDEYVRIVSKDTGETRVCVGPAAIFPEPSENAGAVEKGIHIDKNTAVLVRNLRTGEKDLITKQQVFFPNADQEIMETRTRMKLENHQVAVIKDKDGGYVYKRGAVDSERSFFIGPYDNLVEVWWSSGLTKTERSLKITLFDLRPKFMWFDFEARTKDNVELKLGLTFFWNIVDVPVMISVTDNASGDICSHSRSLVIQAVSQVSLELFLSNFNEIVHNAVFCEGDRFYAERGLVINQVEVRAVACADSKIQKILQDIIQETTNKLNQMVKQEAVAEIKLKEIASAIEVEKQRGQLLEVQKAHTQTEAEMAGKAEAQRVRAFFDGLGDLQLQEKIDLLHLLKRNEALSELSHGNAQVFFTPQQCNLTIENRPARV
eukprot:c8786_g1_i1.p1 GENE.c8786_g1_i1~~c8786_g1_i1.p1  ORF type:complete len:473 (+),score=138.88 c8786_g1_i1:115-1533(+)